MKKGKDYRDCKISTPPSMPGKAEMKYEPVHKKASTAQSLGRQNPNNLLAR